MRTGVAKAVMGVVLFLGASSGAMLGCSSDDPAAPAKPEAGTFCPSTLLGAIGVACTTEGLDCAIGYECGNFNQQGHCICTGGKFACTDATQAAVQKGAQPACTSQGEGNDKACPASTATASGETCTTAGLLCYYQGVTCPEGMGIPKRDQCQCKGSNPLRFVCELEVCNPSSDAGTPVKDAAAPKG